ncbi:hypothetical protein CYPRO_2200 [Cyclonatronum proteinivorum]|uniref:Uncharacterized protein n=1 Tax=Cyclonatronum proteinivorum TaxID=1457365 RepID=A0A345ULU6_9BACT|nr:hypothetical protein [Cyclonatronum proteinivorum]AXJ01448.1 hypothetical protein CYPRO_2200 [Cyclonatronum proteinivorum]
MDGTACEQKLLGVSCWNPGTEAVTPRPFASLTRAPLSQRGILAPWRFRVSRLKTKYGLFLFELKEGVFPDWLGGRVLGGGHAGLGNTQIHPYTKSVLICHNQPENPDFNSG